MGLKHCGIYMFAASAIPLGIRVAEALEEKVWRAQDGSSGVSALLHLPQSLVPFIPQQTCRVHPFCIFSSVRQVLEEEFFNFRAHIFIGATGIAVRAIAPFLLHKSKDPPVIVIDSGSRFVISLLSGHWGGANALARHLAGAINAQPVLSTASEIEDRPALDSHIRQTGLKILDWSRLAAFQGRLLRGENLPLHDPGAFLDSPPWLEDIGEDDESKYSPLLVVDWKRRLEREDLLRLVPPLFCLGFGFRKAVKAEEMLAAFHELCASLNLACESVAVCATVEEKALDMEARKFARMLDARLEGFSADHLARIRTPNPSSACARRFYLPPFSVCESAALAGAAKMPEAKKWKAKGESEEEAVLYAPKFIFKGRITMALALPEAFWKRIRPSDKGQSSSI